ncbi:MAG TPA: hypothetical protein VG407_07020 [Caulobacteraceae bacterium]|nr:hypothetical protein [Caulobacteraceae bacterium]
MRDKLGLLLAVAAMALANPTLAIQLFSISSEWNVGSPHWTPSKWTLFVEKSNGTKGFYRVQPAKAQPNHVWVQERFPTWGEGDRVQNQVIRSVALLADIDCKAGRSKVDQIGQWTDADFRGDGRFVSGIVLFEEPVDLTAKVVQRVCAGDRGS